MPFAVQLFFDSTSEAIIQNVRQEFAKNGAAGSLHDPASRPALSLAFYDELDVTACANKLKVFAEMSSPFALTFSSLGIFPAGAVFVFLAPTVNLQLLDRHAYIHRLIEDIGTSSLANDAPGYWIPRCILAPGIGPELAARSIAFGLNIPLPLHSQVEEIGIVECWPVKHLCSFALGGG